MKPTFRVLLVEDNPGDAFLTQEALDETPSSPEVVVVQDGARALSYLHGNDNYADRQLPHLVLLDLNLPKIDGQGVLTAMRGCEALKTIPVVVLTSSDSPRDIDQAYRAGANCYLCKPIGVEAFQGIARSIESFWLQLAKLP